MTNRFIVDTIESGRMTMYGSSVDDIEMQCDDLGYNIVSITMAY